MKEKYIKTIIKNLTCSKKKKEEIKRQLESDIGEALNTGEKVEDVISRMGEADEITKAFNQSFSEEEKKQFRKERRNRRFLQITGVLAVLILLFWWTVPKNTLLTESKLFDAEEVEKKTELIIQYLDEENYQGVAVVNYTDRETPYTRIIEHKHFEFGTQPKTVITKE